MKLLKKILIALIISSSIFVIIPTVVPQMPISNIVEAASIKINAKKKTLYVGNTYKLKITGTKKKVKWSTSNKKVATVNSNGKVIAKKQGTITITATVGKQKFKCKITVKAKNSNTVYITTTGSKYHTSNCSYLKKSKIAITLKSAKSKGYTPCSKCKP